MTCSIMVQKLPGYLDGGLGAGEHARLRAHLENCPACRQELERYRKLSGVLSRTERPAPPKDLAVRIRVAVSETRNKESWARQTWDRFVLVFRNSLQPLAVPATGGTLTALMIFGLALQTLFAGIPVGAVPNDVPLFLIQQARLESLAPFPLVDTGDQQGGTIRHLVVEATVNARGEMVDYRILAGPDDASVRRQLDQVLVFSRFRPMMSFGRPVPGGRVIINFTEVHVRG